MSEFAGLDVKNLREELIQNGDINALADAGLLDDETVDYLLLYEESYEAESAPHWKTGEPAYHAENTELWHRVVRKEISKNLSGAVQNGNWEIIAFALGRGNPEEQVKMDFVDYHNLEDLLKTPAFMLNIFASPREGKTYTAARLVDLWCMYYPGGLVISNIRSWAETHPSATTETNLPDAIRTAKEHNGKVLLLFDELSSEASHDMLQSSGVKPGVRSFLRKMGKDPYQCSYMGIGHRVVEVAPTLRSGEMAYFGFKEGRTKEESRKRLVIYEDEDKEEKVCDLRGIGLPSVQPDTNDQATWNWGTPEEYAELGFMEIEDDEEEDSEAAAQCQHTKEDGSQCGQRVWDDHDSGLCKMHR